MPTWPDDRPPFVVIEGLDGAGTTTQTRRLVERLRQRDRPAIQTREPSDGPIGALLRQMLAQRVVAPDPSGGVAPIDDDALALMFAADRIDHLRTEIEPALDDGRAVVSDRYYPSSLAYQGEFEGAGEFLFDWVATINERAMTPDLVVLLEASTELCLARLDERETRDIYEERERLERLERAYDQVFDALEAEGVSSICRLDAARPPEELTDAIVEAVLELEFSSETIDPS